MAWFTAGSQVQRAIVGSLFCFNLLEAGIERGNDGIVLIHHRGDELHLIEVVEGRFIVAPDPVEPAAGKQQIGRHDDAVRYPSSSTGDMAPFGAAGDVKKPSHVETGSALMPLLYAAPSRRPSTSFRLSGGLS